MKELNSLESKEVNGGCPIHDMVDEVVSAIKKLF
jgi:hypothetical protein